MNLIEETITILENTFLDGVSLLDLVYRSHNPEYGTWSGESVKNIEAALSKAAKALPKQQLINEYNELADQYECDRIEDWDYNTHQMELEMFIDEVYERIQELKKMQQ
jgi:hypothetical protein